MDVLHDDNARSVDDSQSLAFDDTGGIRSDKQLAELDGDIQHFSDVIRHGHLGGARLVVVAPAVLVNGIYFAFPRTGASSSLLYFSLAPKTHETCIETPARHCTGTPVPILGISDSSRVKLECALLCVMCREP